MLKIGMKDTNHMNATHRYGKKYAKVNKLMSKWTYAADIASILTMMKQCC